MRTPVASPSPEPGWVFNCISTNSALPLTGDEGSGPGQIDSAAFQG